MPNIRATVWRDTGDTGDTGDIGHSAGRVFTILEKTQLPNGQLYIHLREEQ